MITMVIKNRKKWNYCHMFDDSVKRFYGAVQTKQILAENLQALVAYITLCPHEHDWRISRWS